MQNELKYFLESLVEIINDYYEDSLSQVSTIQLSFEEIDYRFGVAAGYCEVLYIIDKLIRDRGCKEEIVSFEEDSKIRQTYNYLEKTGKYFLGKMIEDLKKKYNQFVDKDDGDGFYAAKMFSYYAVLDVIEQQLAVFQYDKKMFKQPIVPLLGQKIKIE